MAFEGDESPPQSKLQPGDIILFAGRSFRARLVNFFQALFARDRTSAYNHAALVTSEDGDILHVTRWFIKYTSLKHRYRRSRVMIVRWRGMSRDRFRQAFAEIAPMQGRAFAFWRQPLLAVRLGWISFGEYMVCSELVARFLQAAGARSGPWAGLNVRDLYDEFVDHPEHYDVLYRGPLMEYF
jgi:hypothetical protein